MRFPEEIERVAEWEALLQEASKNDGATFFTSRASEPDGEGKINSKVEWSTTTKGKMQYDLISVYEEPATCHSIYGLCE